MNNLNYGTYNESGNYTDNALICKNGHVINDSMMTHPEYNAQYCEKCGEKSINKCPECNNPINGKEYIKGLKRSYTMDAPKYCKNCGNPFPWTEAKILAINEIVDLMDELNETEKQQVKETTAIISTDNSRTQLGVLKIKKYLTKVRSDLGDAALKIFVEIASETAMNMMREKGMI